jgi:hypothetical protein
MISFPLNMGLTLWWVGKYNRSFNCFASSQFLERKLLLNLMYRKMNNENEIEVNTNKMKSFNKVRTCVRLNTITDFLLLEARRPLFCVEIGCIHFTTSRIITYEDKIYRYTF